MKVFKVFLPAVMVVCLTACGDRLVVADQKMAEIRSQSAQPIDSVPQPEVIEEYTYSAGDVRSPFVPPSLLAIESQEPQEFGVKPDLNRTQEPLEMFELTELIYRGSVIAPDGQVYGLVQLPNGFVQDVKVGEYIGKNEGQILEITPTRINLQEIVPDARVGFVYKQTSLVTPN